MPYITHYKLQIIREEQVSFHTASESYLFQNRRAELLVRMLVDATTEWSEWRFDCSSNKSKSEIPSRMLSRFCFHYTLQITSLTRGFRITHYTLLFTEFDAPNYTLHITVMCNALRNWANVIIKLHKPAQWITELRLRSSTLPTTKLIARVRMWMYSLHR